MRSLSYPARKRIAHLSALSIAVGCALLLRYPPVENGFYPRCLFFSVFHLQCPGCGATRALAAMLRGDLSQALHWNPMIVVLVPIIGLFLAISYSRALRNTEFHWPAVPTRWLTVAVVTVIVFGIVRNIHSL